MRYIKQSKQQTIIADNAEDYDRMMNGIFEHASQIKEIIDKDFKDKFCSIIRYEYTADIPETLKEKYEQEGKTFYCGECKFFTPPPKGNMKYTTCDHCDTRVYTNCTACDFFYEMMDAGEQMLKERNDE